MNHDTENTYRSLNSEQKNQQVMRDMLPYFFYAAIPIIITIMIAKMFGPSY